MGLFGSKEKKQDKSLPVLPSEVYEWATMELADKIAPSAIEITPKSMRIGDKTVRTFFVISYPRYLTDNWFTPIINLDKIFDVAIYINPIETAELLKHFQKKIAEVESQIIVRQQKGLVRDPMLDTAYQDLEELRDNLTQAQAKMFNIGFYISIYADNDNDLFRTESEIKSMLEGKMIYIKPALFQEEDGFKTVTTTWY
jgi:conjugal transfer ATP-binding protein TraC